jgi:hypothetical protein
MWGATLYTLNATFFIHTQIYKDNIMFIDTQNNNNNNNNINRTLESQKIK